MKFLTMSFQVTILTSISHHFLQHTLKKGIFSISTLSVSNQTELCHEPHYNLYKLNIHLQYN